MFRSLSQLRTTATLVLLLAIAVPNLGNSQGYLPNTKYPAIPTPKKFFGFEIGKRHLRHHQLVAYLREIAARSERVSLATYATSHGMRPLVLLTITGKDHRNRLPAIQAQHRRLADPSQATRVKLEDLPAVIYMGYGVHGNESSASNTAPLIAYYLAAAQDEKVQRLLNQVVILIDPALNPDGFDRFAHWSNRYQGKQLNADPAHLEHNEAWPSGRTNYYWFDLNRDWLPAQHPESQGRLKIFHTWKPNVVLDFHEMGTDATYFFQPGIPARNHPLTPQATFRMTQEFAKYHAKALDNIGTVYFTEERFDDFYMGKGSTYPDLHGAIGILFEQASSRGQVQESRNGLVRFEQTIRNQVTTSLSSLAATVAKRTELLKLKKEFYAESMQLAAKAPIKGYLLTAPQDPMRLYRFHEILHRHQIAAHGLEQDITVAGKTFPAGSSLFVSTQQPEFRFITALFEQRTKFQENIFYDVSTWTLPLAFNLTFHPLGKKPEGIAKSASAPQRPRGKFAASKNPVGYLIDWRNYRAPAVAYQLLAAGARLRVAQRPFRALVTTPTTSKDTGKTAAAKEIDFPIGTVVLPVGIQDANIRSLENILRRAANNDGVNSYAMTTGLTSQGIDLGSTYFAPVTLPRTGLIVGQGVRSYEAGEAWHLLDDRMRIPVSLLDWRSLGQTKLERYDRLIFVSGTYTGLDEALVAKLSSWVEEGGSLIAVGSACNWAVANGFSSATLLAPPGQTSRTRKPFFQEADEQALSLISGSIFATEIDTTHPLGYGYVPAKDSQFAPLAVFRNNRTILARSSNPFRNPILYTTNPLLSGYISPANLLRLRGVAGARVNSKGRGKVVLLSDNPNFRAFWYGTNRVFLNALFFADLTR